MLVVEAAFPAPLSLVRRVGADQAAWGRGRAFRCSIYCPPEAGPNPTVQLVARHRVYGWFASEPTRPLIPGEWTEAYWPLDAEGAEWISLEHSAAWNNTIRRQLDLICLRLFSSGVETMPEADAPDDWEALDMAASPGPVEVRFADMAIEGVDDPPPPLAILDLKTPAQHAPDVGQRFEIRFDLTRAYENPYDPDCVAVDVDFVGPSGTTWTMPAFYCQDYERRFLADGAEAYDPRGRAQWRARFTPVEAGPHTFIIRARDSAGGACQTAPQAFTATAAPFRGFIRVDSRDPAFLAFDNGELFYPNGLIVRSPDDEREQYDYEFDMMRDRGVAAYEDYFTSMAAHRINFTRVWMSAWWAAIEWTHGYRRDYEGLGRYNQLNAWRLDGIVDLAEKLGIYIDLTFHNHGQFRASIFDAEWYDNPYYKGQGGVVGQPDEFWSDEQARHWLRKRLRYIVARWGASPAIAWWELCNEVDLVGNYQSGKIADWHRAMAQYLKSIDPYRHLVAMHYTANLLDASVQSLPENEICQSTGYRADMVDRLTTMFQGHAAFGKPVYLNEFGVGNSHLELRHNLHSGLWASSVMPLCGTALFWWWPYVHEKNEYPQYVAVANFRSGEDWRGQDYQFSRFEPSPPDCPARSLGSQNDHSARLWIYDSRMYRTTESRRSPVLAARPIAESIWRIDGLRPGAYRVQFWDTWAGRVSAESRVDHEGGAFRLKAPSFERDIACKVDRVEDE